MVPDKSVKNPACIIKRSMNQLRYKNKHAAQGGGIKDPLNGLWGRQGAEQIA